MRYTPDAIDELGDNEVFVFGSNTAGNHQGGAARFARSKFGAVMGKGEGLYGKTYALPTADLTFQGLPLSVISGHISKFIIFAKHHKELTFLVTKIGCGIAGFKIEEIAPMFRDALGETNIILPKEFSDLLRGAW